MSNFLGAEKKEAYQKLVRQRKQCRLCEGLTNPSIFPEHDSDEIGPWSLWQGSLNAKVLLVGQDWGGVKYFKQRNGVDKETNPTNRNLVTLFQSIGISIGGAESSIKNDDVFFTNVILCLKEGGLSAPVEREHALSCGEHFLKQLVDIINQIFIIALGIEAYESICACYGIESMALEDAVMLDRGIPLRSGCRLFPVYHCGHWGWNKNRKGPMQIKDWKKIKEYLVSTNRKLLR